MPGLVNGQWVKGDIADGEIKGGAFRREPTRFRDWITPDGEPGRGDRPVWPAAPGRYQLFVAYVCPWASRTLILRKLKGLEALIPVSAADPVLGDEGWTYARPQDAGPALGPVERHYQLYTATDPDYTGKVSVPVLWDRDQGRIVNNESADIVRILNTAFDHLTGNDLDFYPGPLRETIDAWNALIYDKVNNGVYRAGFARDQAHYDAAVTDVFDTLDRLEAHLAEHRYLAGDYLTEADWRLFVTLVRFDAAYHGAFKCNLRRIEDYPNLSGYLRELYQWPGVRETVNLEHIKVGYYTNPAINPTLIVPKGPALDLDRGHDRDRLAGSGVWRRSASAAAKA
ncbi:glutathione S-transferase family protein [Aquisalimonas lutea]|uniref:glutathione S-transferase family protein n=1 Tax=Aquisalimonas lutea TaxID=1327750 RepID=UPI0025B47CFF|nr:glutathione S-transferase family protein [Aquisalimonas lutea]MDN3516377.1 glutathione S-transferase family protein [Aquisalimonas lutea]